MTTATLLLWALALGMGLVARRRGDDSLRDGVRAGLHTLRRTLLLMVVAFVIVGYVEVLAPQALVQDWIGPGSGWRGLVVAEAVGWILPGGPYVAFPLIATLYRAGAGLGPILAMITSWLMLGLISVGFELPFMGWRFTAIRWGMGVAMPLAVGGLAQWLLG